MTNQFMPPPLQPVTPKDITSHEYSKTKIYTERLRVILDRDIVVGSSARERLIGLEGYLIGATAEAFGIGHLFYDVDSIAAGNSKNGEATR